uniref:Uncharacterized protein n=2 Tax=Cacopsylla melanoneura TaxID=428564 RepID=A0A8D8TDV4_9HEMI
MMWLWRRSRRELEQLEVHRGKTMACKCKMKKICGFHVNSRRWGLGEHPFLRKTYSSGHRTIQAAPGIKSHGCGLDKIRIEHVLKKLKPLLRESSYSELFSNQVFLQTPQMVFKLLCPRQILAQRQRSITGVGGPFEKGSMLNSHEEFILNSHRGVYPKFTRGVYPKFTRGYYPKFT